MKKDLSKILVLLRELNPILKEKFYVESVEVFGSYTRDKQTSASDLDLLVTFSKVPGLLKFIELENFLTDRIGINVDLVMKSVVKPGIKNSIMNHAISI